MKLPLTLGAKSLSVSALALVLASPLRAEDISGSSEPAPKPHSSHYHRLHRQARENHEKMRRLMERQDAELQRLTEEMNQAPADKKLDRAVAVINKLVEQRREMHAEMEGMHQKMMRQMEEGK
ncbi:conserved exported protein of unknown function [Methylacidimicrobium sp. AP8]|uniref:hypothetical protein n=1 Tax=Methylacidimicrobium sp. AP8 TaxID=2730359 RepID=UPI0018C1A474|nr:hypothetical protein [Methylacidimicrobium sp. AP8]CAB4244227.1 conserved exported protein of unknown function [Methylacidimicrobium sp. AP8]